MLPVEIRGELRSYQRAGISWLAFLRRCGLHGVLADDMGAAVLGQVFIYSRTSSRAIVMSIA